MKRLLKFIFGCILFVWFTGLLLYFFTFIKLPFWLDSYFVKNIDSAWLKMYLQGSLLFSAIILLFLFIIVLFTSTKRKRIVYKQQLGKTKVAKRYIEQVIKETSGEIIHPSRVKQKVKLKRGNRIKVRFVLFLRAAEEQQEFLETFQKQIQVTLMTVFEFPEQNIHQKFKLKELSKHPTKDRKGKRVV